jgi:Family of unknown function (DUF5677)
MCKEYRIVHLKLVRLWNQMKKRQPEDDRERVLLLQCEAMWDVIDSMRVLIEKKRGVAAFILSRSIFEYSAATDVLARSTDPQLVTDYVDSGKVVLYEASKAMGACAVLLSAQQGEYKAIKSRMGKKKWHGGRTIEDLVNKSQHGHVFVPGESGLYKTFYKEASALSHGDSYVFLSHSPEKGWQLTFDQADRALWGNRGLSLAYQIMAPTLQAVQKALGMDLNDKFDALIPDLESLPS